MLHSYFRDLHPYACVIYLGMLVCFIMTTPYNQQMLMLFSIVAIHQMLHQDTRKNWGMIKTTFFLICALGIFNTIFNHNGGRPFLYVNDVPLTLDSLFYGIYTGLMVSTLLIWFQMFQSCIDNHKMTYMLGKYLPVTALILSMVFCYTDKFLNKIEKIKEVWNSYKTKEGQDPLKQAAIIWTVLLSVMLEDSVETSLSMKARGYGTKRKKKSRYIKYLWSTEDFFVLLVSFVIFILYLSNIVNNQIWLVCFIMIPAIFDIYKEIQWKFYQSKI